MQKKLTVLFAFAIFVLVMGLAITPTMTEAVNCKKNPSHRNCTDGDGGGATVPLCVTISNASTDKVTPDGDGMHPPYCHGEEAETVFSSSFYVISRIANGTGNTTVAASHFSIPPVRSIGLDFSDCVKVDVGNGPIDDPNCAARIADLKFGGLVVDSHASFTFATRGFDIRSLGTSAPNDTALVALFLRFSLKDDENKTTRQINFRNADGCEGDPVTVTRLTDGCWTVESMADKKGCLFKKTARGHNAPIVEQGTYHMPFFMTLQAFSGTFNEGEPFDVATCDPS